MRLYKGTMFRRPWSQRPNGIASTNAVAAGSAVRRPTSFGEAPSRSRNTGRNVPDAVMIPTNTESSWTIDQLWTWVDVRELGCVITATLRRQPAGCQILDDGARHAGRHTQPRRPAHPQHLRRLRARLPAG